MVEKLGRCCGAGVVECVGVGECWMGGCFC